MKKNLNTEQEGEVLFIKNWSLTIIDFISFKSNLADSPIFEMYKDTFSEETMQRLLSQVSSARYMKGLKQAFNDINQLANEWAYEWASGPAKDLRKIELLELNKILLAKFGRTLVDEDKETEGHIKRIIKRGKINNEEEYRIILAKVDEIYADKSKVDLVQSLNDLLLKYDKARR